MILDTNIIIFHIRRKKPIDAKSLIPIVVVGELKAFALKAYWGLQKTEALNAILEQLPIIDIQAEIIELYARIDAFSQNKLAGFPLSEKSSRNMGKNDSWIAAMAIYFDVDLWRKDNDFDHLTSFGLKLIKQDI